MIHGLGAILVGGLATRMGGAPKGLLVAPTGEAIVLRTAEILRRVGLDVVLVGRADAYAELVPDIGEVVTDDPRAQGPLSGVLSALHHKKNGPVLVVACDMPLVTESLIFRLLQHPSDAAIVAPHRDGRFEPLCARYDAARVLPLAERRAKTGDYSLQRLLIEASAEPFPVDTEDANSLRDWDSPDDIQR